MAHSILFRDVAATDWTYCAELADAAKADYPVVPAACVGAFMQLNDKSAKALGVRLEPDTRVEDLNDYLDQISRIEVAFPSFGDGRGYSQARILREHLGFQGELRAIGDVLIDQIRFMQRCGFDAADLADHVDPDEADAALKRYGVWYQPAASDHPPVHRLRRFVQNYEI